jgi:hypothetical protein
VTYAVDKGLEGSKGVSQLALPKRGNSINVLEAMKDGEGRLRLRNMELVLEMEVYRHDGDLKIE